MSTEPEKAPETANDGAEPAAVKLIDRNWYQPIILGGLALVAAALLAGGDIATKDAIAARKAEDLRRSLSQVIPTDLHDNDVTTETLPVTVPETGEIVTVFRAMKGGAITAAAFQLSEPGYGGDIHVLVGIDPQGKLLGARVTAHTETPGLGDKIEARKDDWILVFTGKSIGDPPEKSWGVKKDGGVFDQFAGATITPRAVVKAVKDGLRLFSQKKFEILQPPSREADT